MDSVEGFDGFDLDDHFAFNHEVCFEGRSEFQAIVGNWDGVLSQELNTFLFLSSWERTSS
jgi:hypothetical protein